MHTHTHLLGYCMHTKSLQLCSTLSNPMDHSPPGSSVHGILQARILVWVAMTSSRVSSRPRDETRISYVSCMAGRFFTAELLGKLEYYLAIKKFCHLQQHGWTWRALCQVKEVRHRKTKIVWYHLCGL